jgi:cell wall-associated NlpC family hydrolase
MRRLLEIFRRYKSLIFFGLSVLAIFILVVSCASPAKPSSVSPTTGIPTGAVKENSAITEIEKRLRLEFRKWRGTQHRMGGSSRRSVDCSGFVRAVYKDVFKIDLPRTTRLQVRQGRAVSFERLRAGDLVFFKPPSYPRHVGIYLGGSEFMHASKNRGVTLSQIDQFYWGRYYNTARRILTETQYP